MFALIFIVVLIWTIFPCRDEIYLVRLDFFPFSSAKPPFRDAVTEGNTFRHVAGRGVRGGDTKKLPLSHYSFVVQQMLYRPFP
jgi:hypothetical protein